MGQKSKDKPPTFTRSPIQLRSRCRTLEPAPAPGTAKNSPPEAKTGPGPTAKLPKPNQNCNNVERSEIRPEYQTMSCELKALAKMVSQELGVKEALTCNKSGGMTPTRFERGQFYEEYSAKRNEKLKRKNSEMFEKGEGDDKKRESSRRKMVVGEEKKKPPMGGVTRSKKVAG